MSKVEDAQARERIHRHIAGAQRALVEARGRLVEARERADFEAVLSSLQRAARCVDDAVKDHGELKPRDKDR